MNKPNLKGLTGYELFEYYTSIDGEYKQTLFTAYSLIGDKLYDMLKQAESEGKKIALKEDSVSADDTPTKVVIE